MSEENLVFLLGLGWTDRHIANALEVSERTVRRRIEALCAKYKITSPRACIVFHVFNRRKSLREKWLLYTNTKVTALLTVDDFTLHIWNILSQGVAVEAVTTQVEASDRTVRRRLLKVADRIGFSNNTASHMAAYSNHLYAIKARR